MRAEKKNINVEIGKRLQQARKNNGYTQEQFAETLDVGVEHYRKLEGGMYGLQPDKMFTLYETYRIDPTYLISGETRQSFDFDSYIMNCEKKDKDILIDRMLAYIRRILLDNGEKTGKMQ
ncbi:MAG: helix-turn-helix transcriptional regulator [Lachnospiraceae bacterium]|nr:helix-turn-helix transcriptional regulator [Lachnospiraceae bacterium]